jgi:hypothetical protein
MKIDNNSFKRVKEFKYLGTTIMNQNSIQEEIKAVAYRGGWFEGFKPPLKFRGFDKAELNFQFRGK